MENPERKGLSSERPFSVTLFWMTGGSGTCSKDFVRNCFGDSWARAGCGRHRFSAAFGFRLFRRTDADYYGAHESGKDGWRRRCCRHLFSDWPSEDFQKPHCPDCSPVPSDIPRFCAGLPPAVFPLCITWNSNWRPDAEQRQYSYMIHPAGKTDSFPDAFPAFFQCGVREPAESGRIPRWTEPSDPG